VAPEVERRYGAQITGFILEMNEGRGSTTFNRIGKYMNEWKTSEWVDCL
jgi:predicted aconitase with swiveling domain